MPSSTRPIIPLPGSEREDRVDLTPPVTSIAFTERELRALAQVLWVISRDDLEAVYVRVIAAWAEAVAA